MHVSQTKEYKAEKKQQYKITSRQGMFISDYVKTKYPQIYQEAGMLYNSINRKNPYKPNICKTYEYRTWKNQMARANNQPVEPIPRQRNRSSRNVLYPDMSFTADITAYSDISQQITTENITLHPGSFHQPTTENIILQTGSPHEITTQNIMLHPSSLHQITAQNITPHPVSPHEITTGNITPHPDSPLEITTGNITPHPDSPPQITTENTPRPLHGKEMVLTIPLIPNQTATGNNTSRTDSPNHTPTENTQGQTRTSLDKQMVLTIPLMPWPNTPEFIPQTPCTETVAEEGYQHEISVVEEGYQHQMLNTPEPIQSPPGILETAYRESIEQEDHQEEMLEPSLIDVVPPDIVEKIIAELQQDPGLSAIMSDIEKNFNIQEEGLGDVPDIYDPLELEVDVPDINDLLADEIENMLW